MFRQLRDVIVKSEVAPGTLVSIGHLAGLLGVSRTPIGEALPALQQLGPILYAENGSFRVAPPNREYA